ncbi:MAG: GNAT family N-acetyltransferase [Candidatus Marsarchaeota archaeon]|nr:GNAT family N-acetyltransferase [Candidatus Marsarchaeota archaeon]
MKVSYGGFRIYLESISMQDAESIAIQANDKDIASSIAFMGSFPYPYTLENAVSFVQNAIGASAAGREFHFAIKKVDDSSLVGVCGITNIDTINMKAEIGYWVGKNYWGNGYGKQAANLMLETAFEKLGLNRVYAGAFGFNERSIRILQGVGFTKEGVKRKNSRVEGGANGGFADDVIFGILRNEYKPLGARFDA